MNESAHLWLIPLFPFLGFLLNGILGSRLPRRLVSAIGVLAPLVSFAIVLNDFGATIISAAASCPTCGQVTALALPATEALPFHWIAIGPLQVVFPFLLMFVGWEGVGLASYLLIGFYFQRNSAAAAGKKAFIVNRIGDFGFLIGIFLIVVNFGTLNFSQIAAVLAHRAAWHGGVLTAICLCLLLGAAGKRAQLPLYVWLPGAMGGPA